MAEISAFSQASTRAIGQSKIFLVEKLRQSDDWRAQAFLLEWRWPNEFGRSDARPLPKEPEPERHGPLVSFILSMPDGTQRETTFDEGRKDLLRAFFQTRSAASRRVRAGQRCRRRWQALPNPMKTFPPVLP
jgi:hypothetical protein